MSVDRLRRTLLLAAPTVLLGGCASRTGLEGPARALFSGPLKRVPGEKLVAHFPAPPFQGMFEVDPGCVCRQHRDLGKTKLVQLPFHF